MEKEKKISKVASENLNQSFWSFQFTTQSMEGQKMKGVIQSLKKCGLAEIQFNGEFRTDYYMRKFLQLSQQQVQDDLQSTYMLDKDKRKTNKGFQYMKIPNQLKQKYKMTSFVFSGLHLQIFAKKYFDQIKRLEAEYKYKLFPRGKYLQVYYNPKQGQFSSMFRNQIITMKNLLKIYYCRDLDLIRKLKYSRFYLQLLQKFKIEMSLRYFKSNTIAILYSLDIQAKQIKNVISKNMLYHVTFIHLKDRYLNQMTNITIFKLVNQSLSKQIKTINQQFQFEGQEQKHLLVWIQSNFQECCYAVHDQHQIFSIKPVESLLKSLKNLFIFSLSTNNARSLSNHLLKMKQAFPFIKFAFKRKRITFVLNTQQIQQKQGLFLFLKQIIQFITQSPKIRIYPRNFNYDKNQIKRIVSIAQAKYLDIQNFEKVMEKTCVSQIRLSFKLAESSTFKVQLSQFLTSCILKRQIDFSYVGNKLFQCSYSKINPKEASYSVSTANQLFEENQIKKSIALPFKMPEIDQTLKQFYDIGKLCKKTRQILETQIKELTQKQIQLKVYDILIKNAPPPFQQEQIDQIPLVCKQILPLGSFYYQDVQVLDISDLKKGQSCFIIFLIRENKNKSQISSNSKGKSKKVKQLYVPSYMIKMI